MIARMALRKTTNRTTTINAAVDGWLPPYFFLWSSPECLPVSIVLLCDYVWCLRGLLCVFWAAWGSCAVEQWIPMDADRHGKE
mmetsp:Transcript_14489/g.34592  ORF Transcript_14489/g.34592 Transcript_14489/m.34592 type:complete len:83 (+) Transcript_14489:1126-1374(+)